MYTKELNKHDKRAYRALTEVGDHAGYFQQLLGDGSCARQKTISPLLIKDISDSCVIKMNESVFATICEIRKLSNELNKEVPFFLFGHEERNGSIFFHTAEYSDVDLEEFTASFTLLARGIDKAMYEFLIDNDAANCLNSPAGEKETRFKRAVRCYGHTHPPVGGNDTFSFIDLVCTVEHTMLNEYYSSGEMGSLDVLITPSMDINFIKYESNELMECFMKYRNVFVGMNDGRMLRVPAYERGNYR